MGVPLRKTGKKEPADTAGSFFFAVAYFFETLWNVRSTPV